MSDKVTLKEKISYALVNLGNIPIQTILGSYLLIFYTNIVGLSPASCATLFLIARVLDGLNDPFVGFAIDHIPTTKHGHFRPTLVVGSILCALNFLLLWFGPLMATSGKLAIAYVSYLLIGVLFPVMDISLNSMLPVMTTDMEERNMLSSLKKCRIYCRDVRTEYDRADHYRKYDGGCRIYPSCYFCHHYCGRIFSGRCSWAERTRDTAAGRQ